jgi:2'-5' RNA ligase
MLQGYVEGLNSLRDQLRDVLLRAGLGNLLDRRYRLVTAHVTCMRFQAQPVNLPALVNCLAALRDHEIGTFEVSQVELVKTDWFMSFDRVVLLGRYPLDGASPAN